MGKIFCVNVIYLLFGVPCFKSGFSKTNSVIALNKLHITAELLNLEHNVEMCCSTTFDVLYHRKLLVL